ncbi:sugar isomerase [Nitrosopumilus sp. K4]|uniref:sugar isomerase n=1 Tax=Nitrosopumilus sp. K4 TaxID=2795383 RepID=UPI001BA78B85|nr:sugar isomerase [Nitrosopumilus sp. K4]QUC65319.1 sugar isomerase [Nitrosopumilus sp. K4]
MKTLEAYERDIAKQSDFLKKFEKQKPLPNHLQNNVIFTGSGDSLASAMLAEYFSDFRVKSFDPLDLLKNKHITKNKSVYFVSISGKTISNIKVAKVAKKSIAITANINSKLSQACTHSILLKSPNSDVFTAGSISFLDSALTCISLVTKISIPDDKKIYKQAISDAKKSRFSKRIFVLGNSMTFPLAMYCAAKFYELLGYDAHFERLEQFSHMELFSAKKGDTVIIFEEKNPHNIQLAKNLKKIGLNVLHPNIKSKNKITHVLYYTYFSQTLPLFEAKKRGQLDCNFVLAKKLRSVSDNMIY